MLNLFESDEKKYNSVVSVHCDIDTQPHRTIISIGDVVKCNKIRASRDTLYTRDVYVRLTYRHANRPRSRDLPIPAHIAIMPITSHDDIIRVVKRT